MIQHNSKNHCYREQHFTLYMVLNKFNANNDKYIIHYINRSHEFITSHILLLYAI